MVRRLIMSVCVWYAYHPHMALLRLMGPRCGLVFGRLTGWAHWLLTFIGGQRRVTSAMKLALRKSRPGLNISATLRHYLTLKHQRFAEWYIYPTERGRRFVERTYHRIEGREQLDAALAEGKGLIVLVFHFGLAKMVGPALKASGYENYQHVFRGVTYAGITADRVAQSAMETLVSSEEVSGLNTVYHRPFYTFELLLRLVRRNAVVIMNGDGMMGTDFVELRFLDGTMAFPTGPARLAAHAGAPIVSIYCLPEGLTGHRLQVHPPVYCTEDTPAAVKAAVQSYVALLESYILRYPWAWWTWRRLGVTKAEDGRPVFAARALAEKNGWHHASARRAGSGGAPGRQTSSARSTR